MLYHRARVKTTPRLMARLSAANELGVNDLPLSVYKLPTRADECISADWSAGAARI